MRLKATLRPFRLDLNSYKRALQERMGEALTRAAFEWLEAVTARIPVWSGASMATFQPLASAISLQLAISPVVASRIPMGLAASDGGFGEFNVDSNNGKFTFHYSTSLRHLIYNEFNNANLVGFHLRNPGPYHFQEVGQEAFRRYAQTVRLPGPFKYLKPKTIRVT